MNIKRYILYLDFMNNSTTIKVVSYQHHIIFQQLTPHQNPKICENSPRASTNKTEKYDYIDVGDEYWRPNVLVASLRCWWLIKYIEKITNIMKILKSTSEIAPIRIDRCANQAVRGSQRMFCSISGSLTWIYRSCPNCFSKSRFRTLTLA